MPATIVCTQTFNTPPKLHLLAHALFGIIHEADTMRLQQTCFCTYRIKQKSIYMLFLTPEFLKLLNLDQPCLVDVYCFMIFGLLARTFPSRARAGSTNRPALRLSHSNNRTTVW